MLLGLLVLLIAAITSQGPVGHEWATGTWWLDRFSVWDSYHFVRIATLGYLPPGLDCCDQAYFPGYPLLMAAVAPLTGGSVTGAGLLISLVAGAVAAGLLWLLVAEDSRGGPVAARRAVTLLALAPTGFFFVAVYTEALFLALALGAWLLATGASGGWPALLAALASGVRVNGLFLAAGLAVLYAVQWHQDGRPRPRADVLALGFPAVSVAAFMTHLHSRTGSWDAWREAEHRGWDRATAWPWEGWRPRGARCSTAPTPGSRPAGPPTSWRSSSASRCASSLRDSAVGPSSPTSPSPSAWSSARPCGSPRPATH